MLCTSKQTQRISLAVQFTASQDGGTYTGVCISMQRLPPEDITYYTSPNELLIENMYCGCVYIYCDHCVQLVVSTQCGGWYVHKSPR